MQIEIAKQALDGLAGGTFVGLDTATNPKLKGGKKNLMQGRITKRMTGATVMCFSNTNGSAYNNMVKRRLAEEGKDPTTFEVGPRAWGERVPNTAFVTHKDKNYLEVIFLHPGKVEYFLDDKPINPAWIEGLEDPTVNPDSQGGLSEDNRVVIRTFDVENIVALRTNGKEWV
jgi:hypothetical protein